METMELEFDMASLSCLHMISSFLAMEPPDTVISFARDFGGGSICSRVQSCIWKQCIRKSDVNSRGPYLKRFLKKLILEIESKGGCVLDEMYESYASLMTSLQDDGAVKENRRILKTISFHFSDESSRLISCPKSRKIEVQLQCSLNMLEGDTGCSLWPSSIFLSEFILSFPEIFANKCCFEVGAGVGLAGICLSHVKASKVILTDGDLSTLANMKVNLELNHLISKTLILEEPENHNEVHCVCLPWESASEDDIRRFAPDIIVGADVIYDPSCLPHLVRVFTTLLKREPCSHVEVSSGRAVQESSTYPGLPSCEFSKPTPTRGPVAYVTSVIRNAETFHCFLALAEEANLVITDITKKVEVFDFVPYLKSYDRSSIRIFEIYM